MTTRCPVVLRLTGCQRCGDKVEHYVLRSTDNGLFRVSVCEPCAEILDRKDEAKIAQLLSALVCRNEATGTPRRLTRPRHE